MKRFFLVFLVLFVFISISYSNISLSPKRPGPLILVGGGVIPDPAIQWLKQKAKKGKYIVITCHPELSCRWTAMLGSVDFVLPENFHKKSLYNVGAIIIDGGDQWQYINRLNGKAIQSAHEQGIVILGTSAGAMILSEYYFSAEKGTISSEEAFHDHEGICIGKHFVAIRYLEGVLIDTHFQERCREGRLKIFLEKSGAEYGLGIDEETALCIEDNRAVVLGRGHVHLMKR